MSYKRFNAAGAGSGALIDEDKRRDLVAQSRRRKHRSFSARSRDRRRRAEWAGRRLRGAEEAIERFHSPTTVKLHAPSESAADGDFSARKT